MHPEPIQNPSSSILKIIYLIYALHAFSALSGLLSPALIVTAFLTGWPSVIALIMSYIWKGDASGTYLYSHFNWLINTFWAALVWLVVAWILVFTIVGMVIGLPLMLLVGVWVIYRLLKGLFALNDRKAVG